MTALLARARQASRARRPLSGYAALWNVRTALGPPDDPWLTESLAAGCLVYDGGDVLCLRDHDRARILGRTSAGTLALRSDDVGLHFTVQLPATVLGDETATLVARRDLVGSSFLFIPRRWDYDDTGDVPHRTIREGILLDVGPAAEPAYESTGEAPHALALRSRGEDLGPAETRTLIHPDHGLTLAPTERATR